MEFPTKNGVAFHISVRMGLYGQNVIVFNHLEHGRWHREEHHHNHIQFGRPFCMKIHNEHKKYSVSDMTENFQVIFQIEMGMFMFPVEQKFFFNYNNSISLLFFPKLFDFLMFHLKHEFHQFK